MRIIPGVILMAGCLVLAGCGTFARQPAKPSAASAADPRLPWPPPNHSTAPAGQPGSPPTSWPQATPAAASGILAGQILDGLNRRPPSVAYIQVSATQDSDKAAPIEVAADDQGYFVIQGLVPNQPYRLVARSKYGEQVLAGSAFATPPNPRVVIRISQENANADTPPPPPPPVLPKGKAGARQGAAADWSPMGPNAERPAGLGTPVPAANEEPPSSTLQPPQPPGPPTLRPEDIANRGLARNDSPSASIPGPGRNGWAPADALSPTGPISSGPAPIPSCVLVGKQLHNLALYDLEGRPWEFRDHRARLTLIDFWGSWCIPCLQAIPHLNILQERYGPYGLQVVGIAYEDGPPQIQVDKVRRVADRLRINYQLLLGADRVSCPARIQFGVTNWPTLFLLDESGRIIWMTVGLQPHHITELDAVIRQQLGMR